MNAIGIVVLASIVVLIVAAMCNIAGNCSEEEDNNDRNP